MTWKDSNPFDEFHSMLNNVFGEFVLYGMDGNYIGRVSTLDDAMDVQEVAVIICQKQQCGWLRVLLADLSRPPRTLKEAREIIKYGTGYSPPVSIELAKQLIESYKNDGGLGWKNI